MGSEKDKERELVGNFGNNMLRACTILGYPLQSILYKC
jgi:hypothetical protein